MTVTTFTDLIIRITEEILNPLIILLFALATVLFGWGVVLYIWGSQSEQRVEQGKKIMIGGIIGMFIMASAWGIVYLLCDFFDSCRDAGFSQPRSGGFDSRPGTGDFGPF